MSHIEAISAGSQARIPDLRPEDFQLRGVSDQHLDSNFASQGYWHDVLHRFLSNKGAVVALILIILIVAMAVAGCGVWSLLGQRLVTPAVKSFLMWFRSDWRPSGRVSLRPLRPMLGYSSRLLLSDITNTIYANISELFIGRMYTKEALGYYNRAKQYKDMPVSAVITSVQNVTFPALSQLQDNPEKMRLSAHQVVVVMNFLIFPVMFGLIGIVYDFIDVFLPERWLPIVPYFRILCLSGLFAPLSVVSYNILKIKSDGKLIFRLEMVKKLLATVVLAVTIPISVKAIAWGQTVIYLSDALLNLLGAGRYLHWTVWQRARATSPYLALSVLMLAAVWGVRTLLLGHVALWVVLIAEIVAGGAVYVGLAMLFRPEGWREVRLILAQGLAERFRREPAGVAALRRSGSPKLTSCRTAGRGMRFEEETFVFRNKQKHDILCRTEPLG